jgi:hypothetical protein
LTTGSARRAGWHRAGQPRAAIGGSGAGPAVAHAESSTHERRHAGPGIGREVGIRHAGHSAAVGAGRTGLARLDACVAARHPGHGAAWDTENVLLADEGILIGVAGAAVVFGVARRRRQLADGARGPAGVTVVATSHGVGGIRYTALDARRTRDADGPAAVRVRPTGFAGGATSARGLADEEAAAVGGAGAATAIASALRYASVADDDASVAGDAIATGLASHGATGDTRRHGLTAEADGRSRLLVA